MPGAHPTLYGRFSHTGTRSRNLLDLNGLRGSWFFHPHENEYESAGARYSRKFQPHDEIYHGLPKAFIQEITRAKHTTKAGPSLRKAGRLICREAVRYLRGGDKDDGFSSPRMRALNTAQKGPIRKTFNQRSDHNLIFRPWLSTKPCDINEIDALEEICRKRPIPTL